ncbi:hypothetical protein N665_0664s0020 [Sinapis alba]|nr:hypothetical protein N665_0664s0020 [Sinapis alba]
MGAVEDSELAVHGAPLMVPSSSTDREARPVEADQRSSLFQRSDELERSSGIEFAEEGMSSQEAKLVGKRSSSAGDAGRREARSRAGGKDLERVGLAGRAIVAPAASEVEFTEEGRSSREAELVEERSSSGGSAGRRGSRLRTGGADQERVRGEMEPIGDSEFLVPRRVLETEGPTRSRASLVERVDELGVVKLSDGVGRRGRRSVEEGDELGVIERERGREASGPWSAEEEDERGVLGGRPLPERDVDERLVCGSSEVGDRPFLGPSVGENPFFIGRHGLSGIAGDHPFSELGVDDQRKHRAEKRSSSGLTSDAFEKRSSSQQIGSLGVVEKMGSSSGFFGEFGIDGHRRSSSVAARATVLHRREETIEQGMRYRGLRWSSEGGLVDGFVAADFDEHGSNLDKEVRLVLESDVVVDDGRDIVEIGPGSPGGLSMRDKLVAASKLIIDKEIVDESSSSSDSSSSESSSDLSSESDSVSSSSGTGDGVVDRVVGVERDGVIFQVAGSLSDPTSSCSSDEEPVLKFLGEGVTEEVNLDVDAVLERHRQDGEDVGIVDERVGANGGDDEDTAASGEHGGVSAGEFSEVKGESFDFSYPSYVDCSSAIGLADGEMEQKIKRPRKKNCRMGPFLDHPRDSKSSTVTAAKLEWIKTSCCTGGAVEVRLPGPDERPWMVPDGWVCLYDFWFSEYHLWFPLPRLLLAYCDERCIALSQLTPGSIRNVVGALVLAAECGVHMSLYFLEEIIKITPGETYETFYLSMKSGRCFVREERRKTFDWIRRFFYARITSSSVSDMSRPLMTSWNPYHDRHTVGVPFAPGYKECLAYVGSIGIQNWKLVDRARVFRCVSFISSATWEVRSRMDFSEFPSLSECFAGGNATNAAAVVSKSAGVSVGVGALPSAPGVVVGLSSAPASSAQSADRRREGRGASEKSVVAGGKRGGDPKKRLADGLLAKETSSSKLRKVDVTTTDAPPPSGAPLVGEVPAVDGGEVVFQPFECSFGGTVEDCGELFKKLRMVGDDEGCPLDTSERSEWYIKYARHTTIAAKYVNRLVSSQDAELKVVAAELAKANGKLAAAKGGADRTGEIAAWRKKYEAERKVSFAAQEEVKALTTRMAVDAERAKKRQAMEEERYQKGK